MRRFRVLLLGVCVLLLGPAAFLIQRALHSIDLEKELRHRIVAERIFDETERALSRLLEYEAQRTFEQHRSATQRLQATEFPFVAAYFQVDPEGGVQTLSVADAAGPEADAAGDARREAADDIARIVGTYGRYDRRRAVETTGQVPGTTVAVPEGKDSSGKRAEAPAAPAGDAAVSALDAVRSLNKAVQEREARQQRAGLVADEERAAAPPAPGVEAPRWQELARPPEGGADLPPFSGRLVGARHLVLSRAVIHQGRVYRQGAVLDVPQLERWLREQGLGSNALARHASLSLSNAAAPVVPPMGAPTSATAFAYQHRFAEPFADLTARLVLPTLPGSGSLTYVYALSGLLLAATVLGLAALYQMVSVVVGFAERRNNFVAAVSHELKTPLTAIRMYAEMLRDGMVASDDKRQEYYRQITAESERLSRLINNVLEFAHLEQGSREVALVTTSVAPVLDEVADMLRPHAAEHGFELQVEIEENLPAVRFERDALMQVLWNLADNAIKYARGSVPQRIALRGYTEAGQVVVSVRDHGPGVAARHLGKIFEPFYRGETELTRRNKGTGLGLALVRGLTERMGAEVSGRNHTDGGFEVQVRFGPA